MDREIHFRSPCYSKSLYFAPGRHGLLQSVRKKHFKPRFCKYLVFQVWLVLPCFWLVATPVAYSDIELDKNITVRNEICLHSGLTRIHEPYCIRLSSLLQGTITLQCDMRVHQLILLFIHHSGQCWWFCHTGQFSTISKIKPPWLFMNWQYSCSIIFCNSFLFVMKIPHSNWCIFLLLISTYSNSVQWQIWGKLAIPESPKSSVSLSKSTWCVSVGRAFAADKGIANFIRLFPYYTERLCKKE